MNKTCKKIRIYNGFTLAEVIISLIIGSMVLVSVLKIYNNGERAAATIIRNIDSSTMASEILQRIAEDLDKAISSSKDAKIIIGNNYQKGFMTAYLSFSKSYQDSTDKEQKFEEIVWQSGYDYESEKEGLVLYRNHRGIAPEDRLLDKNKSDAERELFVPICNGVTFFKIEILTDEEPKLIWTNSIPQGIKVTISFAEPFKKTDGTLDVPEKDKYVRTIAIDRTRKIKFDITNNEYLNDEQDSTNINISEDEDLPSGRIEAGKQ